MQTDVKLNYKEHISKAGCSLTRSPKDFWKYVRNPKQHPPIPCTVHYLDSSSNNNTESSSLFSNYFSSVFKIPSTIPLLTEAVPRLYFNLPSNAHIMPDNVLSALENLKSTNCSGPDDISTCQLFNGRFSIFISVYLLFRRSINECYFPSL